MKRLDSITELYRKAQKEALPKKARRQETQGEANPAKKKKRKKKGETNHQSLQSSW